ncbi:hypothetical protein CK203_004876 [Vitis vinifera]|uniref:Retrotransposon gag domain-containing protein n=1 Tax=Vitis vinifera TaxID=29760 RepID=A0A438KGJ9_VITVI|nr:hypothetical protein CK203_004876 [Vitis vinifera]
MCFHPTAKALWDNIIQMYSNLGNQSQIYELQLKLGNDCQGENSVTKYFNVLRGLWRDLDLFNDYEWKNTDDCNYFKKVVESSRIIKFLVRLNVEFDEVRDRIIGRQPLTYLGEVLSEVRREESRRNVMLGKKLFGPVENSTLLGTTATASRNPNNQRHPDDKPRPVEWKTNKQGDSNRFPAKVDAAKTPSLSKEQLDQLLKPAPPTPGTPIASLAQSSSLL